MMVSKNCSRHISTKLPMPSSTISSSLSVFLSLSLSLSITFSSSISICLSPSLSVSLSASSSFSICLSLYLYLSSSLYLPLPLSASSLSVSFSLSKYVTYQFCLSTPPYSRIFLFLFSLGEGVDDHGGPYRAALHTAVGEEPLDFLGLLTLCTNAKSESGTYSSLEGAVIHVYTMYHQYFRAK